MIDALGAEDEVARESAVARLAVIGGRALEHLLQEFPAANDRARVGMLRAFESTADPRTLRPARTALADASASVQTAAIGALRALLASPKSETARDAFDALVAVALDRDRIAAVRLAAFEALKELPPDLRAPIEAKLAADPDPEVSARMSAGRRATPDATWREAAAGRLPATPAALKQALAASRTSARLTELQHVVDHIRAQEQHEPDPLKREEWRAVRGAVHQALAARNSRLALYDLRESLMNADRLPVTFLAAIEEIGDASCLETLAAAYEASSRSGDSWWREHVATAFRAIVHREGLTRRHAAIKRAMARWPQATADLMGRV